jgi:diguanylate cyclase (GGDEF)-like protein/PAS domain S-box-containing protein
MVYFGGGGGGTEGLGFAIVDRSEPRSALHGNLLIGGLVLGGALRGIAELLGPGAAWLAVVGAVVTVASAIGLVMILRATRARLTDTRREADETASRLRLLVEHVPAAVYVDQADPHVSDGGRLAYMSPRIRELLGFEPEELIGDPELWPSRIHPDDRAGAIAAYDEHWRSGVPLRAEYRMLTRDGTEIWVRDEAYAINDASRGNHTVSQGFLVDATDRKRLEAKLMHDALHDPLTGLANRVLFRDHLERALARRHRDGSMVALLFVDLDDFKAVNDTFGHGGGDEVLVQVAGRLVGAIRAEDIAARQGGDEFTVLLGEVATAADALGSADRVLRELRRPIQLGDRSVTVGGSIGIALAAGEGVSADDLLGQADAAMYTAKSSGKGGRAVYGPGMPLQVVRRLEAAG